MNEDREVTVTVTPEDIDFRNRAKAVGLPDILISMYGTALRKLIADEREACANLAEETVCDTHLPTGVKIYGWRVSKAIRARSNP
jgi:hypothetical protein